MKKTLIYILAIILNIGAYALFSIIDVFVDFLVFGKGATNSKPTFWLSLGLFLLQVLILFLLYKKKVLIIDKALLILNLLVTVGLFSYFVVYLSYI